MQENFSERANNSTQSNQEELTLIEAYKRLSRRECEVLEKIDEGRTAQEIAHELFLSVNTVENHIVNIGKKLNRSGRGRLRKWLQSQSSA